MSSPNRKSINQSQEYVRIALEKFNSSVYSWAQTASEYAAWISWGKGAYWILNVKLHNSMDKMNPNNINSTNRLLELAIQPIVTNSYFTKGRRESRSWEENEAATEIVRRNIQGFIFGYESEENIQLYGKFHKQYHQSLQRAFKGNQDHMSLLYCQMLEHRWLECCAGERIIEWDKISFPCWNFEEFMAARCSNYDKIMGDLLNPAKTVTFYSTINQAFKASIEFNRQAYALIENMEKDSWYSFNSTIEK